MTDILFAVALGLVASFAVDLFTGTVATGFVFSAIKLFRIAFRDH
ncbi:hypothetical protein [Bosea sp. F3-2]|nr:hypothetical protein [Bosea sp. F3-2]